MRFCPSVSGGLQRCRETRLILLDPCPPDVPSPWGLRLAFLEGKPGKNLNFRAESLGNADPGLTPCMVVDEGTSVQRHFAQGGGGVGGAAARGLGLPRDQEGDAGGGGGNGLVP